MSSILCTAFLAKEGSFAKELYFCRALLQNQPSNSNFGASADLCGVPSVHVVSYKRITTFACNENASQTLHMNEPRTLHVNESQTLYMNESQTLLMKE